MKYFIFWYAMSTPTIDIWMPVPLQSASEVGEEYCDMIATRLKAKKKDIKYYVCTKADEKTYILLEEWNNLQSFKLGNN